MTEAGSTARDLARGREAFRARAWRDALTCLKDADRAHPLHGEDLAALAIAAYMAGDEATWCSTLERGHRDHLDHGETVAAARDAFWLGFYLASRGEVGPASGWLARAHRLVDDVEGGCVEQGYLLLPVALRSRLEARYDDAREAAGEAARIGERFGDRDLVAWARHEQGRALVRAGRVAEGLELLDEAMVSVVGGECSPLATGQIYCSVIEACLEVYDLRRAQQWTTALSRWCREQPGLVTYAGQCLVHRAEILQVHGDWHEALGEARRAGERIGKGDVRAAAGSALYAQAEIHRLLGDLAGAEGVYRAADRAGFPPQPGLSLLRAAQGETDGAAAMIQRVLGETSGQLPRARLLPACVEIAVARGDLPTARDACAELEQVAEDFGTEVLAAMAAHARGIVALADGDAGGALDQARRAGEGWRLGGDAYEAARARELAGRACTVLGDHDGAALELDAARSAFAQMGAVTDLARLREHPSPEGSAAGPGLTGREIEVLRLVADGRTNKEIAAQLTLSERTVDRHLSNILTKLAVPSRTAATTYALRHGLL